MLRPRFHVGFTNEVQELRPGSLGRPADLRSNKVSLCKFSFGWTLFPNVLIAGVGDMGGCDFTGIGAQFVCIG